MSVDEDRLDKLKKLLDNEQWPLKYSFKFIVPIEKQSEVEVLVPDSEISVRPSSQGKYVSVTIDKFFACSDDIIDVYQRASQISGLLSL